MVWKAALALILAASPASAQTDSPFLNWVNANAPFGFDLTPDGSIWINISTPGQRDDYAILASDLQKARESTELWRSIWVRGYHRRNTEVSYRETKARFVINCADETIYRSMWISYDADGDVLREFGASAQSPVVPGSYGAEYHRQVCLVQ